MFTKARLDKLVSDTIARLNSIKNEKYHLGLLVERIWDAISCPEIGGPVAEFFDKQDALLEKGIEADEETGPECAAFWETLASYSDEELLALVDFAGIPSSKELEEEAQ